MSNPKAAGEARDAIVNVRAPGGQTYGHVVAEEAALAAADAGQPISLLAEIEATGLMTPKGVPAMPAEQKKSPQEVAEEQGTRVWNQWDDKEAAEAQERAQKQQRDALGMSTPDPALSELDAEAFEQDGETEESAAERRRQAKLAKEEAAKSRR